MQFEDQICDLPIGLESFSLRPLRLCGEKILMRIGALRLDIHIGLTPVFKQPPKRLRDNQPVFRQQFTQDKLSVNGSGLVKPVKIRPEGIG